MPSFDLDASVAQAQAQLKLVGPSVPPGIQWPPKSLKEWCASVNDQPEWLLDGILPADCNILMSGKAKRAFKSWMVIAIGYAVASGKTIGPFKPMNAAGVPVLYLSAEGGRAQSKNRFEWMGNGLGVDLEAIPHFYFAHRQPVLLDRHEHLNFVKFFVQQKGIKLVIVDPMVMFMHGDENKVAEMSDMMRALNELRALGATVLFVHHLRKSAQQRSEGYDSDPDEEIRGSSAIAGFYDQHWAIRTRADSGLGRESKINDLLLRSKDDEDKRFEVEWFIKKDTKVATFRMDETSEEATLDKQSAEVELLLATAEGPTSKKRVEEMMGIDDAQFLLRSMIEAGRLKFEGRGYVLAKVEENR